jgi:hypothetical protein
MSSSRGAPSRTQVKKSYPHRVRIEVDLLRCSVSLGEADFATLYRFKDEVLIDGIEYFDFRFGDREEALRFAYLGTRPMNR